MIDSSLVGPAIDGLRFAANMLAIAFEVVGIAVVAIAVVRATMRYARALFSGRRPFPPEAMRVELGRSLALGLEFLLGADIVKTAIDPGWEQIAQLAAIATIRIALNFFLDRELEQERRHLDAGRRDRTGASADASSD